MISTRRGDDGHTDFLFGGRAAKSHPRIHAVGEADELNAVLGLCRLHVRDPRVVGCIAGAQEALVAVMGLLSAGPENAERYAAQGFRGLEAEALDGLTRLSAELEGEFPDGFRTWSVPGASGNAAATWLELARCVCRRAERAVASLPPQDQCPSPHLIPWLNRLSDVLWLAARIEERPPAA